MLSPIKSGLSRKLRDKNYRHRFFQIRAQDELASELRRFRKMRKLKQSALAEMCGTKQSAISRMEQSSYSQWQFDTLLKIAFALDARVRVLLEDMDEVRKTYEWREGLEQSYAINTYTTPLDVETSGLVEPMARNEVSVSEGYIQ